MLFVPSANAWEDESKQWATAIYAKIRQVNRRESGKNVSRNVTTASEFTTQTKT